LEKQTGLVPQVKVAPREKREIPTLSTRVETEPDETFDRNRIIEMAE